MYRLVVSERGGIWTAYVEEVGSSAGRRHAPRTVLWSGSWPWMPELSLVAAPDALQAALDEYSRTRRVLPRAAGPAPLEGPQGDPT
jgi:hypothetical protein